jgi:hypothetical protein
VFDIPWFVVFIIYNVSVHDSSVRCLSKYYDDLVVGRFWSCLVIALLSRCIVKLIFWMEDAFRVKNNFSDNSICVNSTCAVYDESMRSQGSDDMRGDEWNDE